VNGDAPVRPPGDSARRGPGTLWAAAGHPNSLLSLTPGERVRMRRRRVAEVV
jgi:hypothetical protein